MNLAHTLTIRRIATIEATISAKGMTAREVSAAIHLNLRSTQEYLAYLEAAHRAYIENWRPCKSALAQVYRLGNLPSMPKPAPASRTQHHRTYRAKLVKDPVRNDLHLAKRRARDWAARAADTPKSWASALFAGVRVPTMTAEG